MADVYGLNQFLQELRNTGLRLGYQFQVTIEQLDGLQFYAASTTLPGKNINPVDVPYFGQTFKIPTNTDYGGEWSITTRVDNELKIKKALEKWMDEFSDLSKNGGGNKKVTNYNVKIDLLDNDLQTINDTYTLVGVFPTGIGELGLDLSAADVVTMDVTLAFQYWFRGADGSDDPLK
jgi:hypothetical protein